MTAILKTIGASMFIIMCLGNSHIAMGYDSYPTEMDNLTQKERLNSDIRTEEGNSISLQREPEEYPFHQFVTLGLIRFYQKVISPLKGKSCPMYPSDSQYAYLSFKNHNPLKAFMMTADRLHRCGHDLKNYSFFDRDGISGYFDPPDSPLVSGIMQANHNQKEFQVGELSNSSQNTKMATEDSGEDYRLFLYAETLRADGDYDRAITEYQRLLSYFPDSIYRKNSLKGILYCYYGMEKYFSAIHWGKDLLAKDAVNEEDMAELDFFIGASYFKLGNFRLAREYLSHASTIQVPLSSSASDFQDRSLLLQGVSYAKESNWKEAERVFASVKVTSQFAEQAKQNLELARKGENLNLKNPAIAGTLAIVPGLGYLYDGYKQTAIASFLVNGLFIWGTVEAFRKDNQGLGVVLGLFSFGFYTGNIYGSITSAERRNTKNKNDLLLQFNLGFP